MVPGPGWCGTLDVVTVDARVEHVGSLLRPGFLRDARDAYVRGELTPAGLKAAEDRAVREIVAMQEEIDLPVVGDGEMRRESFQSELTAACDGFTAEAQRAKLALLVRAARDFLPASTGT